MSKCFYFEQVKECPQTHPISSRKTHTHTQVQLLFETMRHIKHRILKKPPSQSSHPQNACKTVDSRLFLKRRVIDLSQSGLLLQMFLLSSPRLVLSKFVNAFQRKEMSDSSRTGFRHVQSKERENLLRRARKIALSAHFWPANWPAVGMRPLSPTVYQAQRGFQPTPLLSLRAPAPFHYLQIPEVKERETQSSSKDISGCAIATSTSKAKLFHCP